MQPKVSQFSLHPETGRASLGPRVSSRSSALSRSTFHEVIVPVTSKAGIRAEVDACLDAIEEAYNSRKFVRQSTMTKSSVQESDVHRIDTAIVKDYVETVYRDYGLRNRFGQSSSSAVHHGSPQTNNFAPRVNAFKDPGIQIKVQKRAQSARPMNSPSSPRKYISITQQSKISGRQGSHSILRKVEFTADSVQGSPPRASQSKAFKSTKGDSSFQKIRDDFRFCVNCERPVLAVNSDFHERYDCKGFDRLYAMGLEELATVMEFKTENARKVLRQQLDELKQKRNDGRTKGETIFSGSIQLMQQLTRNPQSSPKQIEQQFIAAGLLREAQNNLYSQSLQQAQKVASFQEITANLKKLADKSKQNGQMIEQMRPITLIRASFNPQVQVGVLPLHPHLHRYIRKRL